MSNLDDNLYNKLESDWNNSAPRAEFKQELFKKLEVYEKLQQPSHTSLNFISYFYIFMKRNILLPVLVLAFALVLGGGGIALLLTQNDKDSNTNKGASASNTVLKGAFEKNPNLFLGQSANTETTIDPRLIAENDSTFENLYTVTTQEVSFGPAFETCRNASDFANLSELTAVRTISTYVDKDTFASREEQVTSDDEQIYLEITNNEDMYSYRGGEYAVYQNLDWFNQEFFDANSGFISAIDDTNAMLEEFDAFITEVFELEEEPVVETNDEMAVITTEYATNCENLFNADAKIIRVVELDPSTFEITKEEFYKDSNSADNLIVSFETSVQSTNKDFSDVENEFELEKSIEIEEADFGDTFEIDQAGVLSAVEANNIEVIAPVSSDFEVIDISVPEDTSLPIFDLFASRDFYPTGDLGDDLFEEFGNRFANADADLSTFLLSVSYTNLTSLFDTDVDADSLSNLDLVTILVTKESLDLDSTASVSVMVDGNEVSANKVSAEKELKDYVGEFGEEFSIFEIEAKDFTYYVIVSEDAIIESSDFETISEVSDFEALIENANSLF